MFFCLFFAITFVNIIMSYKRDCEIIRKYFLKRDFSIMVSIIRSVLDFRECFAPKKDINLNMKQIFLVIYLLCSSIITCAESHISLKKYSVLLNSKVETV